MSVRAGAQTAIVKLAAGFARLIPDRRGVAAVEFALVAPLLLSMYFVTMEVAQGIESNKKVGRVGSMVADLITQQTEVTPSQLDAIMKIGGSILQPYNRSTPKIVVTAIDITANPGSEVKVAWSRKLENGAYSKGPTSITASEVPATLNIPGSFLVRVESYLDYEPLITWSAPGAKETLGLMAAFNNIPMKETYFLRPRMSPTIKCETC